MVALWFECNNTQDIMCAASTHKNRSRSCFGTRLDVLVPQELVVGTVSSHRGGEVGVIGPRLHSVESHQWSITHGYGGSDAAFLVLLRPSLVSLL
jgi:hypothetical protein